LLCRGTAESQERPYQMPGPGRHARQRPAARSTSEAKQYGLRLVIKGVAQQHRATTRTRLGVEGAIPGYPGRCLWPDCRRLVHPNCRHRHVVVAERAQLILHPRGDFGRVLLQTVINHDRGALEISPSRHVPSCKGECQRVSATRAGAEKLRVLLVERCIDGLNCGQGGRTELATTHWRRSA
jgi:hypothetical protein